jgi:hypothetical protein
MKKTIDTTNIANELHGASVFFRRDEQPEEQVSEDMKLVDKSTNQQVSKETSQQVDKSTSQLVNKETSQQVNKSFKRFTTYLPEEHIKSMKRLAIDTNKKEYELYQAAVEKYLKKNGY